MGLFTGLAIGALAATTVMGMRRKPKIATDAPLAPGPVEPLTPPKPPTVLPGANEALAQTAGAKERKRAARGLILTRPKAPASSTLPMAARTVPKSLIGY